MRYQAGESFENMLQLMHFKDNDKDTLPIIISIYFSVYFERVLNKIWIFLYKISVSSARNF